MAVVEVGYTCPDIDRVIKALKSIEKTCAYGLKEDDPDAMKTLFKDIDNDLWNLDGILEDLRSANMQLRDNWIHEKERADELEASLQEIATPE